MGSPRRRRALTTLALVGFAAGARAARSGRVGAAEARCFACLNRLPRRGFGPIWTVMQLGSLGGSVGAGLAVAATGRRRLGTTLAVTAGATWAAAKVVKPFAGRGRPTTVVDNPRVLGRDQAGLGYPSGHAAVAAALAAVGSTHLGPAGRVGAWSVAATVGAARIYVGAHLPLDVLGGASLGLAIGTAAAPYGSSVTSRSARSSWLRSRRG